MSSDDKIMEGGGEGSSHDTHQAITCTIHIMAPTDLGTNAIDSALVASVEAQDTRQESDSSLLVVPGDGDDAINVSAKNIIQTVTETNIGSVDLPVISNINSDQVTEQSIELVTKDEKHVEDIIEEDIGCHCLICNEELQEQDNISVFKSFTATSQRKVSIFLGDLVGQKLTSRKTHSTIICDKCFKLLNKLDLLEFEIQETKEEIITKYQETIAAYGGRARRKKPAAAKKSDYVFPKIEPEEEDKEGIEIEGDEIYQPQVDDLLEEEQDRREDRDSLDEEWEPEVKRARIKRESNTDPNGPPKRKRGRPRKDASKTKTLEDDQLAEMDDTKKDLSGESRLSRPGAVKTRNCVYCEEEVPVLQLIGHMESHEHQQYPCPFCSHSFVRLSLCKHLQEQHSDWLHECEICCAKFINSTSFEKHCESHKCGAHGCTECSVQFATAVELLNHNQLEHFSKSDEKHNCPCGKIYFHRAKFITHVVKFHRGEVEIDGLGWGIRGNLVCQVCRKKFKKTSLYIAHEKMHRSKRLYCPHCPSSYKSFHLLQDHILTHQYGDYECENCNFKFASLQQLSIHEEKVHNIKVCKVCEYCQKEFSERIHLICHRRKEHPESIEAQKARYSCSECGMKFLIRGNLVRHSKAHEREKHAKPHECDICGKVLGNKYSLATHIKSHSGGTFKCSACDKTFVSKYTLQDHVRRIHEEFGYGRDKVCKQCNRSFFKKSELDYHMKTHTGERPYRCEVCGESYLSTSTLRYHMQKHSNTMYVCQLCEARFKNYVGWSAHVKRVHGVTSIREYTKEHGIMQTVVEKDTPSLYIIAPGSTRSNDSSRNLLPKGVISDGLNSAALSVGLEETVVSVSGRENDNIVHVVSYEDLPNPLVHTVDATDTEMPSGNTTKTKIPHPSASFSSEVLKSEGEGYSQSSDRERVMISDEWELIMAGENEGPQVVVTEEWESAHIIVPESGEEQHMVLSSEWDGAQGMTELVVKEGQESHVLSSWKDCVDYE
ncbi:uncharacterized protein [Macrobrachium rosenbergii]|uniref:uncharacterized protein isoform X4 n=1 Tax=Macrobrachium rosenbergii TaxID=79674 RepID=UPI0034D39995